MDIVIVFEIKFIGRLPVFDSFIPLNSIPAASVPLIDDCSASEFVSVDKFLIPSPYLKFAGVLRLNYDKLVPMLLHEEKRTLI